MSVRELHIVYIERPDSMSAASARLATTWDAVRIVGELLGNEAVEVFGAVCLTTRYDVIGYHEVSRGTLDSSLVHPREVFKAAVLSNAAAVLLAHNHPSGDPTPSQDDCRLTERLVQAGRMMGIEVLDHIIIGHDGRYYSFLDAHAL